MSSLRAMEREGERLEQEETERVTFRVESQYTKEGLKPTTEEPRENPPVPGFTVTSD